MASVQVRVTDLAGELFEINAVATWRIFDLKGAIQEARSVDQVFQTLVLGSDVLQSNRILGDLCLGKETDGLDVLLINKELNKERSAWFNRLRTAKHYSVFQEAPESIRADYDMVFVAVSSCPWVWYCINETFKHDMAIAAAAVTKDAKLLKEMPEEVQSIRDVVMAAVCRQGKCLAHASVALRADPEVVFAAVANDNRALLYADPSCWTYETVATCLQRNGKLQDLRPEMIVHPKMQQLRDDRDFILHVVRKCALALRLASRRVCNDLEVVMEAVQIDGRALEHASAELQANADVVLAAVQQHPKSLEFASYQLKCAMNIVLAAVQQDGTTIRFAAPRMRTDATVLCAAMRSSCP